jgi:acyl-CoA reductase-like NAD-dependent aldehyde dehydrogenase
MNLPLIISGAEYNRQPLTANSPYYPGYSYRVATASTLDVSRSIGAARSAEVQNLSNRAACLARAADLFAYTQEDLVWSVRMTGMPLGLLSKLYDQIPEILRAVPGLLQDRFKGTGADLDNPIETIQPGLGKALLPLDGFCYAITPGNDPRAAAIVAANLASLGIPFILRASIRDRAAPLIIRALIGGGFDPGGCNLIYLDREDPETSASHRRLLAAGSIVWTFGPPAAIDPSLRYAPRRPSMILDLDDIAPDQSSRLPGSGYNDYLSMVSGLQTTGKIDIDPAQLLKSLRIEDRQEDLFAGKVVLRHGAGNCAAIMWGNLNEATRELIYPALGYPIVCTATKSIMGLAHEQLGAELSDYLASLVAGDPLDPAVQVGFVDPRCLDLIADLRTKNAFRASFTGGERLSAHQAKPLLVASQEDCPDFFGQEIPAYVLAFRRCADLSEAVETINRNTAGEPRLAVSLLNFPGEGILQVAPEVLSLRAHSILIGKPTSDLLPAFHEGNDYALLLTSPKFISY